MKEKSRRRNLLSVLEEAAIAIPDELGTIFRAHYGLVFRTAYRLSLIHISARYVAAAHAPKPVERSGFSSSL